MSTRVPNTTAKDLLARLLAGENLQVTHDSAAQTAAFDLENRELILPVLKGMTSEVYDLFVAHEVSHALNTDSNDWTEGVKRVSNGVSSDKKLAHTCLNIVEDVRIERMIQKQYPGLRRSFVHGYRHLWAEDFFGASDKDLSPDGAHLLDRLNIHFKAGTQSGVQFSDDEKVWLSKFDSLNTWADVEALAQELFEYTKSNQDQKQPEVSSDVESGDNPDAGDMAGETGESSSQEGSESGQEGSESGDSESEGDSDGDAGDSKGDASLEGEDSNDDGSNAESEEGESTESTGSAEGEGGKGDPGWSQENFDQAMRSKSEQASQENGSMQVGTFDLPTPDLSEIVLPAGKLHETLAQHIVDDRQEEREKAWDKRNKSLVMSMVKEFELKKAADEHRRTSESRTGMLNMNRLHEYKFNDNIFLSRTTVADGKNHGFVFFLDWSGSMSDYMSDTLDQLLNMIAFCKKAGLPCEVYAFADPGYYSNPFRSEDDENNRQLWSSKFAGNEFNSHFQLWQFASTSLKGAKWRQCWRNLLTIRDYYCGNAKNRLHYSDCHPPRWIGLTGTPLQEAMLSAAHLVPQFQKQTGVQVTNVLFLTDGEGCNVIRNESYVPWQEEGQSKKVVLRDPVTGNLYPLSSYAAQGRKWFKHGDEALLEVIRDRTGANLLGIHLANNFRNQSQLKKAMKAAAEGEASDWWLQRMGLSEEQLKNFSETGFIKRDNHKNFDVHFTIEAKNISIDDNSEALEGLKENAGLKSVKNAFKKQLGGGKAARVFANQFIAAVAS